MPMPQAVRAAITVAALAVAAALPLTTRAQTDRVIWPEPIPRPLPPRPWPQPILNQELQLVAESAQVAITGGVAKTHLAQTFQNVTNRTIEGTYVFPLPEGAAVSGFAMTVNGKRMAAEILDGDKAREIYTGIVQKMRDPAILEFIDRNLIRARIFPIPAGTEQKVELEYSESLRADSGSFRYVVPLRLPTGGAAQRADVDIRIQSPGGLRAVYSPTHEVEIKRDANGARVTGEFGGTQPLVQNTALRDRPGGARRGGSDRDFVLYYTVDNKRIGVNLVTYRTGEDDGYFMLLVAPDPTIAQREVAAKDVVFVLDTSGSMEGEKIEQARQALLTLLGNLNPTDRFNIITFSSDVRDLRDDLATASPAAIRAAKDFVRDIKAVGGTNINDAMLESLKMLRATSADARRQSRPQQIVFMTDGEPTVGETDVAQILKNVRAANGETAGQPGGETMARLFVFGVGYDVNTHLLDTLAADNRGASDYVLPQEDIEQKVGSLYSKIAYPVLANPRLDWGGMKVYDVYPKALPDLFRGTQTVVFGRYAGANQARVQLIGTALGHEERVAGQGDFREEGKLNDMLPRLWATRKVGYLMDDARRANRPVDGEVKDEIIRLSKRYGIVTPFTAGLITEDERPFPGLPAPVPHDPVFRGDLYGLGAAGGTNRAATRPSLQRNGVAGPVSGFGYGGFAGGALGPAGAPGPTTGAAAVAIARDNKALREADQVKDDANLRYVDGKAFFLSNGVWTDTTYDAARSPKVTTVKFATPEYFALLKDAKVAKWLSLGERVLIVMKNKTVQVEP